MRQAGPETSAESVHHPRTAAGRARSTEARSRRGYVDGKLCILLVEDDPLDVQLFQSLLECAYPGAFEICTVSSLRSALEQVRGRKFDTACVDLRVTDATGMEIVEQLLAAAPELPLVVLSGSDSEALALQSVRSGAQDFLVKGQVSGTQIGQALRYAQARKRTQAHLVSSAHHDPLTGLANRRHFESRLSLAMRRALREHRTLAAIVVDLDHFKPVNDTYGHAVGDALLKEVSRRMEGVVRETDLVGRIGGDEFAVLLPEVAGEAEVSAVAERILSEIRIPVAAEGISLTTTASLGIAICPPTKADPFALLDAADRAMYAAKRAGGNGLGECSAVHALTASGIHSPDAEILSELYHLVYQPQFDERGNVVSAEALLRSRLADGSVLRAQTLVPELLRRNSLTDVSAYVIETACDTLRRWRARGAACSRVALNVSTSQLTDARFEPMLKAAIDASDLQPDDLELELDLGPAQALPSGIEERLRHLADSGYPLVLDHFAEHTLTWLRVLPCQGVKLSPYIQQRALEEARARKYLQAIVHLCQSMGTWVGATRLQTPEQARVLRALGCNRFQGYCFAAPRSANHSVWTAPPPITGQSRSTGA